MTMEKEMGRLEFADGRRERPAMTKEQARTIAKKYRERAAAGKVRKPLSLFMARILQASISD
jgi:hypothetical protein